MPHPPSVIARLDRATQYSRDGRVQPKSRGVLDRPVKPGDDDLRLVVRRDDGLGALQGRVNPKRRAVERSYPKKKSPARRGRPDEAFVSGRRCGARTIHSDSDYSTT
jgi:hypothetical protein